MIAMLGTHVQTTKNKQLENMRKEGKPYGKKTPPSKGESNYHIAMCMLTNLSFNNLHA